MERTIIQWNIVNWLTIILMVGIGYAVVGAAVSLARQYGVTGGSTAPSNGPTAMADNTDIS